MTLDGKRRLRSLRLSRTARSSRKAECIFWVRIVGVKTEARNVSWASGAISKRTEAGKMNECTGTGLVEVVNMFADGLLLPISWSHASLLSYKTISGQVSTNEQC